MREIKEDAYALSTLFAMLLAFLLLTFATPANAAPVWKDAQGNTVRLLESPCTSTAGVLSSIPAPTRKQMKAASVNWQGKEYAACWLKLGDDKHYFLIDESGDQGIVQKKAFVDEPGA